MTLSAASQRQNQAAEPGASVWLSANAGSGKTRVLTDRVARLLLGGVQPQNILCLTYTKAAASEMQNRLFKRLGEWSMKPNADLRNSLNELGVDDYDSPSDLADARRLFASAIEAPGGLRIQTIHSFCATLLRRFPLEAGVTPNFSEIDDRAAKLLRSEILDDLADGDSAGIISAVATYLSGDDLERLAASVGSKREGFPDSFSVSDIFSWFGLPANYDEAAVLAEVFDGDIPDLFVSLISTLRHSESKNDQKAMQRLTQHDWRSPGIDALRELFNVMLFGATAATPNCAKIGRFPTKASIQSLGARLGELNALMERVEIARNHFYGLLAARATVALHNFARIFLPEYSARKQIGGWLDFDDLILKTHTLLSDEAVAGWVLYRLDGGLDHILVDEAQDTSPVQWQVIRQLAQEFTSGAGARDDVHRTIFVVGDKKQSIYSFQGADPREFDRMQIHFAERLQAVGKPFSRMELEYSFRSSDAILRFVDQAVSEPGLGHRAYRDTLPGRVDLWPAIPKTSARSQQNWYDPVDTPAEDRHDIILAREIADQIEKLVDSETIPAADGTWRRVAPGDILVLVRRRSELFEEIIRACKARGLPVAGADRLKLGAELAVKDIRALLAFLATAEDDLSLAAALRSPLFGWNEADLYDLAANRAEPYLWATLRHREAEFPETLRKLKDLRDNADFLRPYDLIERVLSRHDGRRNLLARLGPEAEDGIDALLAQALAFERSDVPSLTGFLVWLEMDDVEIKRQLDNAGDLIRVMTVHGAKGLESPVVILPDTAKRPQRVRSAIIPLEDGHLIWRPKDENAPECVISALNRQISAQAQEEERLFYVAATRAESWLIIAGAGDVGSGLDSWHSRAETALGNLGAAHIDTPVGPGLRLSHLDWSTAEIQVAKADEAAVSRPPDWLWQKVEPPARPAGPRAPSALGGAKAIGSADGQEEEAALARGTRVHLLLDELPRHPRQSWNDFARRLVASAAEGASGSDIQAAIDEAMGVLQSEELAYLFRNDVLSEVDISARLPELGDDAIAGTIDKLVIEPDRVLAVDFKTNVIVPHSAADTPDGLLRQMGAYQSALSQIYPDKQVDTAILWTKPARLMLMPHDIVRQALRETATS